MNEYYKVSDGWFTYYVNVKTGEKKFKLDETDVCVERIYDRPFKDINQTGYRERI
jgi:hypothetical protein